MKTFVRNLSPFPSNALDDWESLLTLARSLNALSGITATSFGGVQSLIESYRYHVWAVATDAANAESLPGVSAAGGRTNFTLPRFVYNSSGAALSTGAPLKALSGGGARAGLPWMAAALFNNSFTGLMLWSFRNRLVNGSGVDIGARSVTTLRSIFNPVLPGTQFHSIIPTAISGLGTVVATDTSGVSGYNYSSGSGSGVNGYYSTSAFSADDGFWAFKIGDQVEGDSGPTYKSAGGFGFGNFNSGDTSSDLYWNGVSISASGYVGFLFCNDL